MASAVLEGRSKELEGKEVSAEGGVGPSEVGEEMLAAAEQTSAEEATGEEVAAPAEQKEESELLTANVESLAGDAKSVSVLADELANEKVERIRTKRVREDSK
jgi:hypothetical protein